MEARLEDNRHAAVLAIIRLFAERTGVLEELLQVVIDETARLANATCLLALRSDDGDHLDVIAKNAIDSASHEHVASRLTQGRVRIDAFDSTSQTLTALRSGSAVSEWLPHATAPLSPARAQAAAATGAQAVCALPLRHFHGILGVMTLFRAQPAFDQEEIQILQGLADHATLAIENARLLGQLQHELSEHQQTHVALRHTMTDLRKANERFQVALKASRAFAAEAPQFERLLQTIVEHTATHIQAYAGLALLAPGDERLEFRAQYAYGAQGAEYVQRRNALLGTGVSARGDSPAVRALWGDSIVYVADPKTPEVWQTLDPGMRELVQSFNMRDFAAISLWSQGKPVGVLFVHRFGDRTSTSSIEPPDLELLRLLADHAALAISNSTLLESVSRELDDHRKTQEALKKTEESFRQAQRMEAVGRLAGGVAHDFNNILSVVLGYAELVLEQLRPGDPLRAEVEEIRANGQRAAQLTRQLLAFSRKQILSPRVLCMNDVIEGVERMLRRLLGEDVELRLRLNRELRACNVDSSQLEQVLLNLVVNARDAMPDGGKLTIETDNVVLDHDAIDQHSDAVTGPHIMLSVADNGIGMDAETRSRIFEPFFTTKPKDRGTGLGLATVYGIIRQSNGAIRVHTALGAGTTFKIYIPEANGAAVAPVLRARGPAEQRGHETVLVVEDDSSVRSLVQTILSKHGYWVLSAANGGEALMLCEHHSGAIHLLLTDVIMPTMSGRQLAERLSALRPDMKVLYMSGYTEDAIVHHGVLDADVAFIQKPISPQPLLLRVRSVLDAN